MSQANVLFDAPGPKTLVRNRIIGVIAVTILLVLIGLLFWGGLRGGQFTVDKVAILFQPITWTSSIIPGLINTLQAAEISIVTALVLGILLGVGRLSDLAPVRWLCSLIVEFFRAVPVLVMMIFTYQLIIQVLLPLGLVIDSAVISLTSVVVGLTLYNAAVIAELLRSGGMHALPKGQREAGLAIGLSSSQTRWAILLPQAITAMLPSLVSQLVVVLKDSALGSIVLYPELLRSMNTLASNNGNTVAALTLGALLYIIINFGLTNFAGFVEKKASRRTAGRIARVARKADRSRPARTRGTQSSVRDLGGPGLPDHRHPDLSGIGEFLFDLLGDVAGDHLRADLVDVLGGGHHHPDLAAGLHRECLLHPPRWSVAISSIRSRRST